MNLQLREQPPEFVWQYGTIPIAFEVREFLRVEITGNEIASARFSRCAVDVPYVKDYDALPDNHPRDWHRWDLSKWFLCAAFAEQRHVGGAAIIIDTSEIYGARSGVDEAVLWDIRVHPDQRNRGIGRQLLAFSEQRARLAGKKRLSAETQNNNIAACQLYESAGFALTSVDRFAYPTLPNEVQLIWSKQLAAYG